MTDAELRESLHRAGYIADESLATALWLAGELERPLLIEGDAGVGKTALAGALARARGQALVRLQCHEGLDLSQAAYEWNYGRQLLAIRLGETQPQGLKESDLFARDYLLERPLLQAISSEQPCVLLIDEIDRADEAFEAFLLEVLADYQITVPELGTLHARHIPQVVLTSNGTRELSDALRRRCLYHYLDYPSLAREIAIVRATLPEAEAALIEQAVSFVQRLRREDLAKAPGVAETLDWVRALHRLSFKALPEDPHALAATLACLVKTREDRFQLGEDRVRQLIEGRRAVGVAEKSPT
ncbi:AAA family ATPase [Variovorax saccharolyticus]|uniref:AAA family ATPase n=1 Tax=Variovorax saccharolyticus TaxID=3053516 RepID=UPI0025789AB6|nr:MULTISPECIES: MoxR family ATPase [unclassified Variovorax]MDM0019550.1 MoxR family ATPase [Variovorax sp. J22R187]MDM0029392.1 MoxR family ATPase [Variovorax sp. J31P216]